MAACTYGRGVPPTATAGARSPAPVVARQPAPGNPPGGLEIIVTRKIAYTWPAAGPITSYFGSGHPTGIDIGLNANEDSPVRAAADGVVSFAGGDPCCSLGNHVEIQHPDGSHTKYGHLQRIFVSAGESVAQGAAIGLGGSTGAADGKHLHFEVIAGGAAVDPLRYLPALQDAQSGVQRVATGDTLRIGPASSLLFMVGPPAGSQLTIDGATYQLSGPSNGLDISITNVGPLQAALAIAQLPAASGLSFSGRLLLSLVDAGTGEKLSLSYGLSFDSLPTLQNAPSTQVLQRVPTPVPPTPTNTPVIGRLASPTPRPTLTPYAPPPTRTPLIRGR
jgi:hypothetical protein